AHLGEGGPGDAIQLNQEVVAKKRVDALSGSHVRLLSLRPRLLGVSHATATSTCPAPRGSRRASHLRDAKDHELRRPDDRDADLGDHLTELAHRGGVWCL